MVIASLCTSVGQLLWKLSTSNQYNMFVLLLGFIFYGLGAILMIIAFKYGSFSVLHPILGLGYVFALFLGSLFLNEEIGILKWFGVMLIIGGVILIGSSHSE